MKYMTCYLCGGTGLEDWEEEAEDGSIYWYKSICPRCEGSGRIEDYSRDDDD